jgi:uridylate kinase
VFFKFVVKLGGSFLLAGGAPNASLLTDMAVTVKSLASKGHRLVVVVGGGVVARQLRVSIFDFFSRFHL